jgi:signal peptidase I
MATRRSTLREYVEAALWALVLTLILRAFVIQAFRIPSESMRDTLLIGDFLFVNKFEYGPKLPFTHIRLPGLRPPRTGDVIVFQYPRNPSQDYIKRCIATGGQTVQVRNKHVIVDGDTLVEPYTRFEAGDVQGGAFGTRDNFGPFTVPPGELFMMGDNRDNSSDSRVWGTVPMDYVKGRALFLYWSWDPDRFRPRWNRLLRPVR